ncbi:UNVERIFIED_CONTAM: hypothetical protein Sradi_2110800 [Sesamum radiatum]|uniref:Retrotransposon gag domain-containing protein n=1 Tax=Sesamum radiatum TaxID=300843 RepID=A0AAW2TK34_SESRA
MPRFLVQVNSYLIPRSRRPHVDSEKKPSNSKGEASTSSESETGLALDIPTFSDSEEEVMAQNPERTIKEMTSLDLNQQPLCIEYPTLDVDFELKSGLIHLLPTFRGLAGEDPHKHLKEFHVVCSGMRPQGVTEEQVKLRAFPFSLGEKAKDWLYSLPSGSIISWNELKKQFLENYFPASRTTTIRKEISGIRQFFGENFHEYWGRFKYLVESCPHHQIPDHLLIQYFYEGLSETNRSLVDAASGGALYDKTPTEARKLITIMAANNQQFGNRSDNPPRKEDFPDHHKGDMIFFQYIQPRVERLPKVEIWRSTSNFQRPPYQQPPPPPQAKHQFRYAPRGYRENTRLKHSTIPTRNSCKHPKFGVSNEPISLFRQSSRIPSEKELQLENSTRRGHAEQGKTGEELKIPPNQVERSELTQEEHPKVFVPRPPFPEQFAKSKKEEDDKEIFETLSKVEVNIPLLDAIKQVPRYAKFLKEMCTNKSKLRGNERVIMGENVSAILQRKLPPKCKDPGTFSIPCKIGNIGIEKAMCDLGASINVMPLSIYGSLNIGPLKETCVVLQLADRSIVYPEGVLEDVLVQVNELIFPADFYVINMMDNSPNFTSILLGRPFLKTSKTKIDVDAGILSMEFDNEVVSFSIGDTMQNSHDVHSIFS